jgi:FixJ family two-component response regulator
MSTPPLVFIVDDETPVRVALAKLLRAIGVPVELFASAEAFLASDIAGRHGLLMVDLRMPGMNGLDLIEELHRRDIHLPAIVMTGHTERASLEERLQTLQPIGFLEKPFTVTELREALAACQTAGTP